MSVFTRRVLIVIPAADRERANSLAAQLDPVGGTRTFTVPLNTTGTDDDPPTHYWCAAQVTEEQRERILAMRELLPNATIEDWDLDREPNKPSSLLTRLNLRTMKGRE